MWPFSKKPVSREEKARSTAKRLVDFYEEHDRMPAALFQVVAETVDLGDSSFVVEVLTIARQDIAQRLQQEMERHEMEVRAARAGDERLRLLFVQAGFSEDFLKPSEVR